jgi:hypothetical protein
MVLRGLDVAHHSALTSVTGFCYLDVRYIISEALGVARVIIELGG